MQVGGEILDVSLTKANRYARFVECGVRVFFTQALIRP